MSTIHDALLRAQGEKDARRGGEGAVLPLPFPVRPAVRRGRYAPLLVLGIFLAMATGSWFKWQLGVPATRQTPADKPASHPGRVGQPKETAPPVKAPTRLQSPVAPLRAAATPRVETKGEDGPPEVDLLGGTHEGPPAVRGAGREEAARYFARGLELQKAGFLQEAIGSYDKCLALDPAHAESLNNIGVIHLEEGRYEAALGALEKAAGARRDYVDPYYNMACLHCRRNDQGKALFYLKKAVALDARARRWALEDEDLRALANLLEFQRIVSLPEGN